MTSLLAELFQRDLEKLKKEVQNFDSEEHIWHNVPGVVNSSGTLCLHILGNLQHFIGAVLGETGYIRDREFEFSGKPVELSGIIKEIDVTRNVIAQTLKGLKPEDLQKPFPIDVFKDNSSTEKFLFHLYGHLNWHLGQINYLRRILEPAT